MRTITLGTPPLQTIEGTYEVHQVGIILVGTLNT